MKSLIAGILIVQLVVAGQAFAEDVTVTVKGMVCSFCAQGLKRTFEKRPEVKGINVDLDSKLVTIHFEDGKTLTDAEIEQMIKDAGFTATRVEPILGGLVAIHSGWKI